MEAFSREVEYYRTADAKCPYQEWFERLKDDRAKYKIDARIARLRGGNFGDSKPIGDGVSESKIDYGPGYRIYYGIDGRNLVVLLTGGDKATQHPDIKLARKYWSDYKNRKNEVRKKAKE